MKWERIAKVKRSLAREQGTIFKDWGGKLTVALIYPNTYFVGMSSLGMQTLYRHLNERPDIVCERVFLQEAEPISWESQRRLTDFDLLAFTLSFELDYFHVVQMLRQAGVPPLSADRSRQSPLLIAGGPAVSANPEPVAAIFDAIAIGEAEEVIGPLVDRCQSDLGRREAILASWAAVPGVYVPAIAASDTTAAQPIKRQYVRDLSRFATHSTVLTPDTEFGDLYLIEIARGCGRGCRFCLAGYQYRPPRERHLDTLLQQAREGLKHRRRIGLVSAAVSDFSRIDDLAAHLRSLGALMSVSSLRADSLTETLVRALSESGARTLTIAPEAGCDRLRRTINKPQSEQALLQAVKWAAAYDFPQLKLYFMLGHPDENDQDVSELVDLVLEARRRFPRRLTINLTPFVPKAHTPFQWAAMAPAAKIGARQSHVRRQLGRKGVIIKSDSPAWAEVQGVLARGDRRIARVLLEMSVLSLAEWRRGLRECGVSAEDYLRSRELSEPLPWSVVDTGTTEAYLRREWQLSRLNRVGHACPPENRGCDACGVCEHVQLPSES